MRQWQRYEWWPHLEAAAALRVRSGSQRQIQARSLDKEHGTAGTGLSLRNFTWFHSKQSQSVSRLKANLPEQLQQNCSEFHSPCVYSVCVRWGPDSVVKPRWMQLLHGKRVFSSFCHLKCGLENYCTNPRDPKPAWSPAGNTNSTVVQQKGMHLACPSSFRNVTPLNPQI